MLVLDRTKAYRICHDKRVVLTYGVLTLGPNGIVYIRFYFKPYKLKNN